MQNPASDQSRIWTAWWKLLTLIGLSGHHAASQFSSINTVWQVFSESLIHMIIVKHRHSVIQKILTIPTKRLTYTTCLSSNNREPVVYMLCNITVRTKADELKKHVTKSARMTLRICCKVFCVQELKNAMRYNTETLKNCQAQACS